MSVQRPNYPCEYRGNTIHDEKRVSELPEHLLMVQGGCEIDRVLDCIGVDHDRSSIVTEDSYSTLWVDIQNGEYSEVWGIHRNVPHNHLFAVRFK